jgi:hypothetical protein
MKRSAVVTRDCVTWIFGTLVLPLGLIAFLVVVKGAAFDRAVDRGELVALGTSIAGASIALEMIVFPGAMLTSVYRLGLISILLGNVLFYAGTANVKGHAVTTLLNANQIRTSVILMCLAATFGVAAVARQTWHGQATKATP